MSLLFVDGFDHYGAANDVITLGKWGSGPSFVQNNTSPRTGVGSGRLSSSGSSGTTKVFTPSGGFVVGYAIHITLGITASDILKVVEGAITHLAVNISAGGILSVKRGTTTLATGTKVLNLATYYYIEFKGTIHDTTGSYELRIDGVQELVATNVDTNNGGTNWDRITLTGCTTAGVAYIDDFYLCDTGGAAPTNNFLGPIKIETLLPQTDAVSAGSNAGLTPSTGIDHGALVDEVPPNTTDYNGSATVGVKDTYQYPSMALTGTIVGIQTNLYCAKSDATARTICGVVRTGGVDFDGAAISPTTTFQYQTEVRPLNPQTGVAWTIADVTALQAGMKVVS